MSLPLRVFDLGFLPYRDAWDWQQHCADDVQNGADDALGVVEHPPVYTFGRRVRAEHMKVARGEIEASGAELVYSDRGGDVTFHGPGQLVVYPIIPLRRHNLGAAEYVFLLEETLLRALAAFGLRAERVARRRGVWLDGDKVGAIGVRVQGGVTQHGFALNVDCDLSWFEHIVPCGIADAGVTSMAEALGFSPGMDAVRSVVVASFADVFGLEPVAQRSEVLVASGGGRW